MRGKKKKKKQFTQNDNFIFRTYRVEFLNAPPSLSRPFHRAPTQSYAVMLAESPPLPSPISGRAGEYFYNHIVCNVTIRGAAYRHGTCPAAGISAVGNTDTGSG